jgi:hypothetical protein
MGQNSSVVLNLGAGGASMAAYQDSSSPIGLMHQKILFETQTGSADPVLVNVNNPLPIQGPAASGSTALGFPLLQGAVYNTALPTITTGQVTALQTDSSGRLIVNVGAGGGAGGTSSNVASSAPSIATAIGFTDGTNLQLGHVDGSGNVKVNIAAGGVPSGQDNTAFTAGTTNGLLTFAVYNDGVSALTSGDQGGLRCTSDRKLYVAAGAAVSGGWSGAKLVSANTTNATSLKATPGQLGFIAAYNNGATIAYLKLYNLATSPTVGSSTVYQSYMLPATGGGVIPIPGALAFSTGIAYAITGGAADSDTTAVAAAQVIANFGYL